MLFCVFLCYFELFCISQLSACLFLFLRCPPSPLKKYAQVMDTVPCAARFLLTGTPLQVLSGERWAGGGGFTNPKMGISYDLMGV
jgi:hypothetical protein